MHVWCGKRCQAKEEGETQDRLASRTPHHRRRGYQRRRNDSLDRNSMYICVGKCVGKSEGGKEEKGEGGGGALFFKGPVWDGSLTGVMTGNLLFFKPHYLYKKCSLFGGFFFKKWWLPILDPFCSFFRRPYSTVHVDCWDKMARVWVVSHSGWIEAWQKYIVHTFEAIAICSGRTVGLSAFLSAANLPDRIFVVAAEGVEACSTHPCAVIHGCKGDIFYERKTHSWREGRAGCVVCIYVQRHIHCSRKKRGGGQAGVATGWARAKLGTRGGGGQGCRSRRLNLHCPARGNELCVGGKADKKKKKGEGAGFPAKEKKLRHVITYYYAPITRDPAEMETIKIPRI